MRILNKKALHNYFITEHLEAGIQLLGHEVKSIRSGRVDLGESSARVLNSEAFLINANIPRYNNSSIKNYEPQRTRKLLLHSDQIKSLIGKLSSGLVLVPISIYDKNNFIKVELGLGRSKKQYDKRAVIKERDNKRRVEQELRGKE